MMPPSVDPTPIDIYLSSVILSDPAWYSEANNPSIRLSKSEQLEMQLAACTKGVASLEEWLVKLEVEPYILAPIVSEEKWDAYEQTLETFGLQDLSLRIEPRNSPHVKGMELNAATAGSRSTTHSLRFTQSSLVAAKL